MLRQWSGVGAAVVLAVLTVGCGPRFGNVSGTVKFNGKPLSGATITFYDQDKNPVSSAVSPSGAYTITKVRTGKVKVAVAVPLDIPFMSSMPGSKPAAPKPGIPLPTKYLDPEVSGLDFEVRQGDQTHDFDLSP